MAREWRVPTVLVRNCWHHQANMQVKMVATTGRLPVIETALLDVEDTKVRLQFFQQINRTSSGRGENQISTVFVSF